VSALRGLLRLDDKLAAEGRRLHQLGGRPLKWLTPLTLVAAAAVHAALLLLPAVTTKATYPAISAAPDFPLVWRPLAPRDPDLLPQAPVVAQSGRRGAVVSVTREALVYIAGTSSSAPPAMSPAILEPIVEPDSESILRISAEVEALIPDPDPPPPVDFGPPLGIAQIPTDAPASQSPPLVQQVRPVYPPVARNLNAEGHVTLRVSVEPDGSVGSAAVEDCSRPGVGFEAAALASVKKWRYAPAPGQPVRTVVVTIHFKQPQAQP
jgi:TonB family protein